MVAAAEHALVIVESPAKAKTIQKILGNRFRVVACFGHIRDLARKKSDLPSRLRAEPWAELAVDVSDNYKPYYVIPTDKKKKVRELKDDLSNADVLYLATDGDREGEAIAWHLMQVLKPSVPVHRLVFHEITRKAIETGMQNTRDLDMALVNAQETRRILDRLLGYSISPILWTKIASGRSAGRVQSVAVRMLVERERERMAFCSAKWWDLKAGFTDSLTPEVSFEAELFSVDGKRLAKGRDFDPKTGEVVKPNLLHLDEQAARLLHNHLQAAAFTVTNREDKPYTSKPKPPFTTSTLQQEASRKLSWSSKKTMGVAQQLYQNGHITYMRTDSTNLSDEAVAGIRMLVERRYGRENLSPQIRTYRTKAANAQEAHEAIRPTNVTTPLSEAVPPSIDDDERRLFELIWKRTIACQMADARGQNSVVTLTGKSPTDSAAVFIASGRMIEFPGYRLAYVEGTDDVETGTGETALPPLTVGDTPDCTGLDVRLHTTQPKDRYTESSLIKVLEERGIGRPSTYAASIEKILDRKYCVAKGRTLIPTWTGFAVTQLMEDGLPEYVDYDFTARLEEQLDQISQGHEDRVTVLRDFYEGKSGRGLTTLLNDLSENLQLSDARTIRLPNGIEVSISKHGAYIKAAERNLNLPDELTLPPADLDKDKLGQLLEQQGEGLRPIGVCPTTGLSIFKKTGHYGPYVERGERGEDGHKTTSLLPAMTFESVTLEEALQLLDFPKPLGAHPATGAEIVLKIGRFGPYVACGSDSRSIPKDVNPLEMTAEAAIALLDAPKAQGRRGGKTVIRELGNSPTTKKPIQIIEGKYGPYVTDGKKNASLPKGADPSAVGLRDAITLITNKPSRKRQR
jgi:DNA topoisomerase-1